MYLVKLSKVAQKEKKLLKAAGYEKKAKELLSLLQESPYKDPPPYEKLIGELKGNISRRINIQHRLVYEVFANQDHIKNEDDEEYEGIVFVRSMWSHYENI